MDDSCVFYDADAPAIIIANTTQWTETELLHLLESIGVSVFSQFTSLEYLSEFLDKTALYCINTEKIQKTLLTLIKGGFGNTSLSSLRRNRQKIVNLVRFLQPKYRLPLGTQEAAAKTAIPENIFSELWKHDADILIIPRDLDDNINPGTAQPLRNDVLVWLKAIHSLIESQPMNNSTTERCLDVATNLLNGLKKPTDTAFLESIQNSEYSTQLMHVRF